MKRTVLLFSFLAAFTLYGFGQEITMDSAQIVSSLEKYNYLVSFEVVFDTMA